MPVTSYYSVDGELFAESTGSSRLDYMVDPLGSVTETVDQTSTVRNQYRYKPYGAYLLQNTLDPDPKFMWTGATGSRATGAPYAEQYNRARHYGRKQAAWTSVDPLFPDELSTST